VPIAGDVPYVGQLFRYDARRREKTNLMVFLKPTIVRGGNDGREFTSERYRYLQGEQQRMDPGPRSFWNDPLTPALPPKAGCRASPAPPRPDRRRRRRPSRCGPTRRRCRRSTRPSLRSSVAMATLAPAPAIPYAFARTHGVLAAGEDAGAVIVLVRPTRRPEGLASCAAC
jgi:hypothetical protein